MRDFLKIVCLTVLIMVLFHTCKKSQQSENEQPRGYIKVLKKGSSRLRSKGLASNALDYIEAIYSIKRNPTPIESYFYYAEKIHCYSDLAKWPYVINHVDTAIILLEEKLRSSRDYQVYRTKLHLDKAVAFTNLKLYSKAAFELYSAKSELDSSDRKSYNFALYNIYSSLASLHYNQTRFGTAIDLYKKAVNALLKGAGDHNPALQLQSFYNNIGFTYSRLGQADSAISYYNKALYILQHQFVEAKPEGGGPVDWHVRGINEGMIYGNRAKAYESQGKLQPAVLDYKENIRINNRPGFNIRDANFAQLDLAGLYLKLDYPDSAKALLDELNPVTVRDRDIYRLYQKIDAQYLNSVGKYRYAYKALNKYYELKLAADTNYDQLKSINFEKEFKNFEQDVQIDAYKKKSEIRQLFLLGAVIFGLMATAILLVVTRSRKRERKILLKIVEFNQQLSLAVSSLEQRNQEYSELMSILAHDLYGPLTTITHSAETFLLDVPSEKEDIKLIKAIKNSGTHMIAVIESILDVQKATEKRSATATPTNVNDLLNDSIALMGYSARSKNIEIVYHPCFDCFVSVRREDLWRIVNNLINNAIKFSYEGDRILVSLSAEETMITIKIQDFGIGIPEELKDHLFQIFSNASRTGTAAERSFGLGLYIVKQITAANQGKIGFSSDAGQGTTFFVQFPRVI